MTGLMVFKSIEEAARAGFTMYDRRVDGVYIVRKRTDAGWAMALVDRKVK